MSEKNRGDTNRIGLFNGTLVIKFKSGHERTIKDIDFAAARRHIYAYDLKKVASAMYHPAPVPVLPCFYEKEQDGL